MRSVATFGLLKYNHNTQPNPILDMPQLTVGDLKRALENIPDEHPVYFRRVAPICGNIEEAGSAELSEYAFFGQLYPCVIVEPMKD